MTYDARSLLACGYAPAHAVYILFVQNHWKSYHMPCHMPSSRCGIVWGDMPCPYAPRTGGGEPTRAKTLYIRICRRYAVMSKNKGCAKLKNWGGVPGPTTNPVRNIELRTMPPTSPCGHNGETVNSQEIMYWRTCHVLSLMKSIKASLANYCAQVDMPRDMPCI